MRRSAEPRHSSPESYGWNHRPQLHVRSSVSPRSSLRPSRSCWSGCSRIGTTHSSHHRLRRWQPGSRVCTPDPPPRPRHILWNWMHDGRIALYLGIRPRWSHSWFQVVEGRQSKLDVPLNAMMLSMAVQIILGILYFGSSAAFNAFSGVGVICLTVSYAVPIAVSLFRGRTHIKDGKFDMGMLGLVSNVVALCKSSALLRSPLCDC